MIKGKINTTLLHIIAWLIFFSLPVVFIISQSNGHNDPAFAVNPLSWLSFTIYITIFYLHTWFLFPEFFEKKKFVLYGASVLLTFVAVLYLSPFDQLFRGDKGRRMDEPAMLNNNKPSTMPGQDNAGPPSMQDSGRVGRPIPPPRQFGPRNGSPRRHGIDIISVVLFILVLALSIALLLEKKWRIAVEAAARAETDKANAELSFLKAQINPHFLFNTLNNIYSLAVTKNEHVADAVMKLSNLMRYVTDEVNQVGVPLSKEMDAIDDYISLQKLRLGKKAVIEYSIEGITAGKYIGPLILMPFVENAFKHGISSAEAAHIKISLVIKDNVIVFETMNVLFAKARTTERTGIGTTNTKKRLAQLYADKYELDIKTENGFYHVRLLLYI